LHIDGSGGGLLETDGASPWDTTRQRWAALGIAKAFDVPAHYGKFVVAGGVPVSHPIKSRRCQANDRPPRPAKKRCGSARYFVGRRRLARSEPTITLPVYPLASTAFLKSAAVSGPPGTL